MDGTKWVNKQFEMRSEFDFLDGNKYHLICITVVRTRATFIQGCNILELRSVPGKAGQAQ